MRRRDFITLVGGAVAVWSPGVRAQQGRQRKIGFLCLGTPDPQRFLNALRAGLHSLGYDEGNDFQLEVRSAEGSVASLTSLAHELVASKMDVIVAFQTPAATAAKLATVDVPIVIYVADSVRQGFANSLSRPGGNLTGVDPAGEATEKNLEIVRELLPSVQRVAILANANDPFHEPFLEHIKSAAGEMKIEVNTKMVRSAGELNADFMDIAKWRAEAVLVQPSLTQRGIADLALQYRIPAMGNQAFVELGGLASYNADPEALYRRCADFVVKILNGARPADLPIELPTKFLLAINLQTAKALDLVVPPTLLARSDEVIE